MFRNSRGFSVLDTVGIELETDCIKRGNLPLSLQQYFQEEHDASIETRVAENNGRFFELNNNDPIVNTMPNVIVGSELVSKVFTFTPEYENAIKHLTNFLISKGETEQSERSGIHFHISFVNNLNALKNFLRISAHLEEVLYYLGGMGYEFRGVKNDCTYCRPITKFGPPVLKSGSRNYQMFKLEDIYRAQTMKQLFDRYGGINVENPPGKYYPVRYGLVTIFPMLNKGTVEFRAFNKTLNPNYIWAAAKFCQAICYRALESTRDLEENSIYSNHSKNYVIDTFIRFVRGTILESDALAIKTLITILERTPEINLEPVYFYSHLSQERFRTDYSEYSPEMLPSSANVKRPNFIDIHVLDRERR